MITIFVDEGWQAVIIRGGHFHRMGGPGRLVLNPLTESTRGELDVRDHLRVIPIPDVPVANIVVDLELRFRSRLDIAGCLPTRDAQAGIALLDDMEREIILEHIVEVLVKTTIQKFERQNPSIHSGDLWGSLSHIMAGSRGNQLICQYLVAYLKVELKKAGHRLNSDAPLSLQLLRVPEHLDEALANAFSIQFEKSRRSQNWEEIVQQLQQLPPQLQTRIIQAIEEGKMPAAQAVAGVSAILPSDLPFTPSSTITSEEVDMLNSFPGVVG